MYRSHRLSGENHDSWHDPEEGEDAVSLGGDEDDMQHFYAYSSSEQDPSKGQPPTPKSASISQSQPSSQKRDHQRDHQRDSSSQKPSSSQTQISDNNSIRRSQSLGKLTHALPPKPVLVAPAYIPPSPAQTSTLASAMVPREKKTSSNGKSGASLDNDPLPPDWEVRYSRSGTRDKYFYNVKTHKSTWSQPGPVSTGRSSPSRERDSGTTQGHDARSPRHSGFDDTLRADISEKGSSSRTGRRARPSSPPNTTSSLTYEDRHYRPAEASNSGDHVAQGGRRELGDFYRPALHSDSPPVHRASSPRPYNERRRSRSLTPRRDDHYPERATHRSGDSSPEPSTNHGMWRDARDEDRREAPDWDSARMSSNPNAARGRSPEGRPQSRYESMDVDLPSHYEPKPKDKPARQRTDEWSTSSTLFASSHSSRDSWLCSSQGGGRMFCDCLEKPWELSYAALSFVLSSASSRDRLQDAHHGSLFFYPIPFVLFTVLHSLPLFSSFPLYLQEIGRSRHPHATLHLMRIDVLHGGEPP